MKFATKQIHAGQHPEETTGAVITPIFQTSTYSNAKLGESKGYDYGRTINPTRIALEQNLAALENGKHGFCFSSGMAAVQAVITLFKPGDHVICTNNVYGGTYRLFEQIIKNYGLEFSYVDTSDNEALKNAVKENTRFIYVETPTNPMLNITSLKYLGELGKSKSITTCVDNTFMSPYFQNPLDFGIDVVLHSSTKYINGHSDVIGGCLVTSNDGIAEKLKFIQNSIGAVPAPFDCWLILRSTKTLAQRMRAHNENAVAICEVLSGEKKISKIYYPGLETHPQYKLAKSQMRGFSGIISIELGSFEKAVAFCNELKIFQIAESLGGVESLVCHPVSMTHGTVPKELREKFGLTDGLVRLSVGIEDKDDLLTDIKNALLKL
ncbi:MAG TPA: PLP-dependent aspartate aminotransferase family protein [Ignavibacteria bacterium]|nr:PLP-dependent aspartate aminotransferase family protein [Ignavibacteria bacterium]HMR39861.1 PLP-dependent aspartate aminotransferase family protein [Ignavibacteria bacterium]